MHFTGFQFSESAYRKSIKDNHSYKREFTHCNFGQYKSNDFGEKEGMIYFAEGGKFKGGEKWRKAKGALIHLVES